MKKSSLFFIIFFVLFFSCSNKESFFSYLIQIDNYIKDHSKNIDLDKLYANIFFMCQTEENYLSILKRAFLTENIGDRGRILKISNKLLEKKLNTEKILSALGYTYLKIGRPEKTLQIFDLGLSIDKYQDLWAQAYTLYAKEAGIKKTDFIRLSKIYNTDTPLVGSAIISLISQDIENAQVDFIKALNAGFVASTSLLWDMGKFDYILTNLQNPRDFYEYQILGDAAAKLGNTKLAFNNWKEAIFLDPKKSWKPWLNIAILSKVEGQKYIDNFPRYFFTQKFNSEDIDLIKAFALVNVKIGRFKDALDYLSRAGEVPSILAMIFRIKAIEAETEQIRLWSTELLEKNSESEEIFNIVCRVLFSIYEYDYLQTVLDNMKDKSIGLFWFYNSAMLSLNGYLDKAESILTSKLAEKDSEIQASFALATLKNIKGDKLGAANYFERAANYAQNPYQLNKALKAEGQILFEIGNRQAAFEAFSQALLVKPDDDESRYFKNVASKYIRINN